MLQAQTLFNWPRPYFCLVNSYLNKIGSGTPRGVIVLKKNQLLTVILNEDCS
jgi:hypothetical protein